MEGWGAVCQGSRTGGPWSIIERQQHINVLELKAVKIAILTFHKRKPVNSIHLQIDNMAALSYLLKMGGTHSMELIQTSKEIWDYLHQHKITITAEYLPSKQNVIADWESRHVKDSSKRKLSPNIFKQITKKWGTRIWIFLPQVYLTKFQPTCHGNRTPFAKR